LIGIAIDTKRMNTIWEIIEIQKPEIRLKLTI